MLKKCIFKHFHESPDLFKIAFQVLVYYTDVLIFISMLLEITYMAYHSVKNNDYAYLKICKTVVRFTSITHWIVKRHHRQNILHSVYTWNFTNQKMCIVKMVRIFKKIYLNKLMLI